MRMDAPVFWPLVLAGAFLLACSPSDPAEETGPPSGEVVVVPEETILVVEEQVDVPVTPPAPDFPGSAPILGENGDGIDLEDSEQLLDAIGELESEGGQDSIDALGRLFERADDPLMKLEIIDSLAFLAEEGDVRGELEAAMADGSPEVRVEAADVIAELSLFELLPALRAHLYRESDIEVREAVEDAIEDLEYEEQNTSS